VRIRQAGSVSAKILIRRMVRFLRRRGGRGQGKGLTLGALQKPSLH
jgi:hypothetical protein